MSSEIIYIAENYIKMLIDNIMIYVYLEKTYVLWMILLRVQIFLNLEVIQYLETK